MNSTSVFSNKVAVITGAGSGIGQALAIRLAGSGARLALADLTQTEKPIKRLSHKSYRITDK